MNVFLEEDLLEDKFCYYNYIDIDIFVQDIIHCIKNLDTGEFPMDLKTNAFLENDKFGNKNNSIYLDWFNSIQRYEDGKKPIILKVFNDEDEEPYCRFKFHNDILFLFINRYKDSEYKIKETLINLICSQ